MIPSPTTRALLACGALFAPLFVAVFLVAGALRADYDPLRHPVSSLALTGWGWTQTANFVVSGLLVLALAVGVRRALGASGGAGWKPWLVGTCGIGLIGAGVFVSDPLSGYPPGAPDEIQYTTVGLLHDLFSMLLFAALFLACLAFGRWFARRGRRGWAAYSLVTAVAFAAGVLLSSAGFSQTEDLVEYAGLLQRGTLVVGFGWLSAVATHLLRAGTDRVP